MPDVYIEELSHLTDDAPPLPFTKMLFATGGRPRTLPGANIDGVHLVRTLADAAALRKDLQPGSSLLVVGAGFIGAEIAASARALDCAVTVLEAQPSPLPRVLPPEIASVYSGLHRENGVEMHLGVGLRSLRRNKNSVTVTGTDGAEYTADAVVLGVGMEPDTALAEHAGLSVRDGIVVDPYCATSVAGVYAAGDVARFPDPFSGELCRVEHWQNAVNQGAAAARNMLGARTPFREVPWCWSDQYGVNLQVCGHPSATDEVRVEGDLEARRFHAVFTRDGRTSGAIGVNAAREIRALRTALAEQFSL